MTIPNKLVLTCTITGKKVTWTNKKIIQKKIEQYGSLDAFVAQFKCKGANKKEKVKKVGMLKPVLLQGVEMGKMTPEEYHNKYVVKTFSYNDGTSCTVSVPKVDVSSTVT
jgi:hypothetical protein